MAGVREGPIWQKEEKEEEERWEEMINPYYNKLWDIIRSALTRTVNLVAAITMGTVRSGILITIFTILTATTTMELILTCCYGQLFAVLLELSFLSLLDMFTIGRTSREGRI